MKHVMELADEVLSSLKSKLNFSLSLNLFDLK